MLKLIGQRIGKLTVVGKTEHRKNGYTVWRCRCQCGRDIFLDTRYIQRGTIRDCGCTTKVKPGMKDLTGMRFGKLIALEPTDFRDRDGRVEWLCRCDCGGSVIASAGQLKNGMRKSCGCLSHPPLKDYVGKRFGFLTVTGYVGKRNGIHRWKCKCQCGNVLTVSQSNLQIGHTSSCGCIRGWGIRNEKCV